MKIKLKALIAVMIYLISFRGMNVYAMNKGIYLVSTITSYTNPITGKITDNGIDDEALGELMCKHTIYAQAFLEVDNGSYYITTRMKLASQMSQVSFKEQTSGNHFSPVHATLMQSNEEEDTMDYRFKVSKISNYIEVSMFIDAMERMVNFYLWINPSDTVVGKGDFIQTIQLETDSLSVTNRGQLIKPAHQHSEMVQISSSDAVKMPMIIPLAVATAGTSIYFKAVKKSVNKSKER